MPTFRHSSTLEVREIPQEIIDAWVAANNPKALVWEAYTPPPPPPYVEPVPPEVGPYQIREAMLDLGWFVPTNITTAFAELNTWILGLIDAAIPPSGGTLATNARAKRAWMSATVMRREHPLMNLVRQAAGKTNNQMDTLFRTAATF